MEYSRPPNPTPSRDLQDEQEVPNTTSCIVHVDDLQKGSVGGTFAYMLRGCDAGQTLGAQPSLSDLIKQKLVTLDGTDQHGLNRTPSLSDLMDFEISPGDLVSESAALSLNGDVTSDEHVGQNRDKCSHRKISPLARLGHRKYTLPKSDSREPTQHVASPPKRWGNVAVLIGSWCVNFRTMPRSIFG